jgi:hypothetical protein
LIILQYPVIKCIHQPGNIFPRQNILFVTAHCFRLK